MYLSSSGHGVNAVGAAFLLDDWRLFCSFSFLLLFPSSKPTFKFPCSSCAEVIPCPNHVGSMGVMRRVEGGEQGEHFGRVAAAAEDDEEVCGGAALWGRVSAVVEGREDVD